jgi:lipid-A-disaccharide synthase
MLNADSANPSVLIVAAEASSSLYALRLLQEWKKQNRNIYAFGIGSRDMEKEGFEIVGRSEELAVVGISEVLAHWGDIKAAFYGLLEKAKQHKPKVALLLDYPDFNLRLAKKLKAMGIPVVYYISPQIWAWRTGRVNTIRDRVDRMLVLFPFEKDFYEKHQVPVDFVGHPLLDELNQTLFDDRERNFHRAKFGVRDSDTLLALMPGSRRSEIKHHLAAQLATAKKLHEQHPNLKVALLVAPTFEKEEVQAQLGQLDFPILLIKDEPFTMISLADVVLCASGTATLMVGLMEKPMVIMYRMNAMTAFLAKRFVKHTEHFGMINLILNERVVPELFQEQASVEGMAAALSEMIASRDLQKHLRERLARAKERLGRKGATARVAQALQPFLDA